MERVPHILLAEDNPGDVFLVKHALERHSVEHELTIAADGQSAWKFIDAATASPANAFDIFLLDLNLPIRSGLELLARIRLSSGKIAQAIIVIVTSSNSPHDRAAAVDGGADHYFCKPSNLDGFLELGAIVKQLWIAHASKHAHESPSGTRRRKREEA